MIMIIKVKFKYLLNRDMDEVLAKLEAEQQNTESLRQVNTILREQLDSSNKENLKLSQSVKRLKTELDEALEVTPKIHQNFYQCFLYDLKNFVKK